MSKEINIDNEEEILKECDFDYYYDSEMCSGELCMFYNNLCNKEFMNTQFNKKQAKIDLGRIGITINKQYKQISDLEAKLEESEKKLNQYQYKNDVIEKQYEEIKNGIKFRIENNITNDWEQHYHCIDVLCEKHKARIIDVENGICKIKQLEQQLTESEKKVEELKGERIKFYTDDVRRTQVINGVHFDIEHLLVFSEYVEHENWVKANKDKEIDILKQQLAEKEKELAEYKRICTIAHIEDLQIENMLLKGKDQDKISFCIEQLGLARRRIDCLRYNENKCLNKKDSIEDCLEVIDTIIKKIKGENDG